MRTTARVRRDIPPSFADGLRGLLLALASACLFGTLPAHARIGLLVGEPFGRFGTMMPNGHAAVWFDHLCADTPTHVRACVPGELGIVVSRFHDLSTADLDWLATPAPVFLYGTENPADIPAFITPELRSSLRERYRELHLMAIVPDRRDRRGDLHLPGEGDWSESIGAAFDRRLLLYSFDTTPAQDALLLARLNNAPNHRIYSLHRRNCADFAAGLLSVLFPGKLGRSRFVDLDMTTPKTLARQLDDCGRAHPELHPAVLEIPQLPGSLPRSRPMRGAAESLLTNHYYLLTLLAIQPEIPLVAWIVYKRHDRWTPGLDAACVTPSSWTPADLFPIFTQVSRPTPAVWTAPASARSSTN